MQHQQMNEQLWNYIDGSATSTEKAFVEKMLSANEAWKAAYVQQLELHHLLTHQTELQQPSLRFSKNVMETVAGLQPKAATSTYVNKTIIRSIAAFFIVSLTALLVLAFMQVDWSISSGGSNLFPFNTDKIKAPELNVSKLLNPTVINAVLMLAMVLGLMVFDGFLRRKKSAA